MMKKLFALLKRETSKLLQVFFNSPFFIQAQFCLFVFRMAQQILLQNSMGDTLAVFFGWIIIHYVI
jgi:hypothetical protein